MNRIPTPLWKTAAVELFVLQETDVTDEYVGWLNNPDVNRFLECRFAVHTPESVREFVRGHLLDPASLFCGIRSVAHSYRHVGNIKLSPIEWNHGQAEVGIMIGDKTIWGKGIGTEAIRVMANIARSELGLHKLSAGLYGSNIASQTAFRRAGFKAICQQQDDVVMNDKIETVVRLDCLL